MYARARACPAAPSRTRARMNAFWYARGLACLPSSSRACALACVHARVLTCTCACTRELMPACARICDCLHVRIMITSFGACV